MTNEEFDNLKQELLWEGSQVAVLDSNEQARAQRTRAHTQNDAHTRAHTHTHTHAPCPPLTPPRPFPPRFPPPSASWRRPCPSRAASRA
jgi:hypothetical protein